MLVCRNVATKKYDKPLYFVVCCFLCDMIYEWWNDAWVSICITVHIIPQMLANVSWNISCHSYVCLLPTPLQFLCARSRRQTIFMSSSKSTTLDRQFFYCSNDFHWPNVKKLTQSEPSNVSTLKTYFHWSVMNWPEPEFFRPFSLLLT